MRLIKTGKGQEVRGNNRRKRVIPPYLGSIILRLCLRNDDQIHRLGDFEEVYQKILMAEGRCSAVRWYWRQVLRSVPELFKNSFYWSGAMLKNYIRIAFRNMRKHKGYSFINIAGLAVGMAGCILILLWVQDELSYDTFHEHADRICRVTRLWTNADGAVNLHLGHVAPPIAPLLKNDFSEIEEAVRMICVDGGIVGRGDQYFQEDRFFFAEANIFRIFSFEFIQGNPETALMNPMDMAISDEMALKYFDSENPMGKTLSFEIRGVRADFQVTGVFRRMVHNSHFHADIFASFKAYEMAVGDEEMQSWSSNNYATYLLLSDKQDMKPLKANLDAFIDRHYVRGQGEQTKLVLQKLTDIHLRSHLDSEIEANGDIKNVYIFSSVAFFILIIACLNFMNLATARSLNRAKEVGLRKVVGAQRFQVILQFLSESILLAVLAFILALLLVFIVLPHFNQFIGKALDASIMSDRNVIIGLLGIVFFVGIAAGSYPAFFLSSFRPARVLRGLDGSVSRGITLRTVMVVLQFVISIVLIASMGIVSKQLTFMRADKPGFIEENVVVLPSSAIINNNLESFKHRLLQHHNIVSVSAAKRVPSSRLLDSAGSRVINSTFKEPVEFMIASIKVDHDYIPTYGMQMAAGRNFSRLMRTDSMEAFILNETAVKRIGWTSPDEAIGQEFECGVRCGRIIGVVKDFNFESMHQEISPIVLYISRMDLGQISIRIRPDNIPSTMNFLKNLWREVRPRNPFRYFFIDERFDQLYRSEEKLRETLSVFALLAIFIACLGLYGLVSFMTQHRTKEIGIRKVLGSSVSGVVVLLVSNFARWVLVSNVIALPLAWLAMDRWLKGFAYHIRLNIWFFAFYSILTLIIAILTVSHQALKAAFANPVDSLRNE